MKQHPRLKAAVYILQTALYILLLPLTAVWLYKSRRWFAQLYYYNMCYHNVFRMLYCMLFACGIATINTLYTITTHDMTCASLTLAVSFPFLFDKFGHPMLSAIRGCRQLQFFIATIALVAMFTPHLYPFAFSLYMLLVATVYWPSNTAVDKLQSIEGKEYYREHPAELSDIYFA